MYMHSLGSQDGPVTVPFSPSSPPKKNPPWAPKPSKTLRCQGVALTPPGCPASGSGDVTQPGCEFMRPVAGLKNTIRLNPLACHASLGEGGVGGAGLGRFCSRCRMCRVDQSS